MARKNIPQHRRPWTHARAYDACCSSYNLPYHNGHSFCPVLCHELLVLCILILSCKVTMAHWQYAPEDRRRTTRSLSRRLYPRQQPLRTSSWPLLRSRNWPTLVPTIQDSGDAVVVLANTEVLLLKLPQDEHAVLPPFSPDKPNGKRAHTARSGQPPTKICRVSLAFPP